MKPVSDLDRKYFPLFVVEFPEFTSLYEEWRVVMDRVEAFNLGKDRIEEDRLAKNLRSRMNTNGWA